MSNTNKHIEGRALTDSSSDEYVHQAGAPAGDEGGAPFKGRTLTPGGHVLDTTQPAFPVSLPLDRPRKSKMKLSRFRFILFRLTIVDSQIPHLSDYVHSV